MKQKNLISLSIWLIGSTAYIFKRILLKETPFNGVVPEIPFWLILSIPFAIVALIFRLQFFMVDKLSKSSCIRRGCGIAGAFIMTYGVVFKWIEADPIAVCIILLLSAVVIPIGYLLGYCLGLGIAFLSSDNLVE